MLGESDFYTLLTGNIEYRVYFKSVFFFTLMRN